MKYSFIVHKGRNVIGTDVEIFIIYMHNTKLEFDTTSILIFIPSWKQTSIMRLTQVLIFSLKLILKLSWIHLVIKVLSPICRSQCRNGCAQTTLRKAFYSVVGNILC